jgi:prophage DNA circulation protein
MTWEDRVSEGAYVAPDGTRQVFQFEDVSLTIRKKTIAHEFPNVNATFVEDKGLAGTLYPLVMYFSGEDHDLQAAQFESLLRQRGPGRLEHPMYGVRTVVPFGDIGRSDALVTAANQTAFTVTFWETIVALYPAADADTLQLVDDAVNAYDVAGATQLADSLEIAKAGANSEFRADMGRLKDGVVRGLEFAKDGTAELQNKMNRIDRALSDTLSTFVGDPTLIAFQLKQLAGAPARSAALLRARLDAYGNLARSIFAGTGTGQGGGTGSSAAGTGVVDPGTGAAGARATASNNFHANRLTAELVVISTVSTVSGESYRTRGDALASARELAELFDELVTWSEDNFTVLFDSNVGPSSANPASTGVGSLDTGEARQVLQDAVTAALGYLIAVAFTLGIEKSLTLSSSRTAVDLTAQLYGGLDRLDEFIDSNELTGAEILEIPAGRTVRYYVE